MAGDRVTLGGYCERGLGKISNTAKEYLKNPENTNHQSVTLYAHNSNLAMYEEYQYIKTGNKSHQKKAIQYATRVKKAYIEYYNSRVTKKNAAPIYLELATKSELLTFLKLSMNALDVLARQGDFDSFCIAVEFARPYEEQFYLPRRECFLNLEDIEGEKVNLIADLQEFVHGKLDFMFFSCPQRVGKSTLCFFANTYRAVLKNNYKRQTFGITHSVALARHFFTLELSMFEKSENSSFRLYEIFPNITLANSNNEYKEIDICEKHTFPSFKFASIDGQVTGSTEAGCTAYADDLIKEQNEVLNKDTADKIWTKVNTYIFGRSKKNVPILGAATLWGDNCPFTRYINHIKKHNTENMKIRIRQFAWCNQYGESQFDYHFDLGFDTEHFKRLESTMSVADFPLWSAMYLSKPTARGTLPFKDNVQWYTALPTQIDMVGMAIDSAIVKQGDYWSAVVGYFSNEEKIIYIEDFVFTNAGTDISIPLTVAKIIQHRPQKVDIEEKEATRGAIQSGLHSTIKTLLAEQGHKCNIKPYTASGSASKWTRIVNNKSAIQGIETRGLWRVLFNKEKYEKEEMYRFAVDNVMNWSEETTAQRSQHDDAPDSICILLDRIAPVQRTTVETFSMSSFY